MAWPAPKWERFWSLHQRRTIIAALERQRDEMVAALYANSNWDDDKGTRTKAINDLRARHEEALEAIDAALSSKHVEEEEKLTDSNPFFAATERGLRKIEIAYEKSGRKIAKKDEIDYMHGLDQE